MNGMSDYNKDFEGDLWLCLYFPSLPLEVFTRGHTEEESHRPVVVLERQRVAFLNEAAGEIGIQVGSSMDTAYTLSSLVVSFERDEKKEADAIRQLAHWTYQFTPLTNIKTRDSLLLNIRGCLKLFGGLGALKIHIAESLASPGFKCQMAVYQTPLGALALAKDGASTKTVSLEQISLMHLECDEKAVESLHKMGIHTVGQLLTLPTAGLGKRFGTKFLDYLARLTGKQPDPQQYVSPAPEFFSEIHFLSDVTNTASLVFPMKRLLEELTDFLIGRQLSIDQFTWRLSHRDHKTQEIPIYLANPDNNKTAFLTLTQLKLEQFDRMPEVDSLALAVKDFSAANSPVRDLFHGTRFLGTDASMLLNIFQARLGAGTCFGLSLANDHRPEKAWRLIRLNKKDYWSPAQMERACPRPFYLLSSPKQLQNVDDAPYLNGQLELLQGPERIDFGWWDAAVNEEILAGSSRDYFVAKHKTGALYWVFKFQQEFPEKAYKEPVVRWYLHGVFS